jgi:mono/diheme cytochrome c family protein
MASLAWMKQAAAALAAILLAALALPRACRPLVAIAALAAAFAAFGAFEWFRESLRKPWAVTGIVYGNGLLADKAEQYRKEGLLAHVIRTGNDGADLFRRSCASCHTLDGYNPLRPALEGMDADFAAALVKGAHVLKGNMPQFLGTDAEAALVAGHLKGLMDPRPLHEIAGLESVELGRRVWEKRCGVCHVDGGWRDVRASVADLNSDEDVNDLLEMSADMGEFMPPFTGTKAEREALIAYVKTIEGPQP